MHSASHFGYLLNTISIFPLTVDVNNRCRLKECQCLCNIKTTMQLCHKYVSHNCATFSSINFTQLLNDFNHLLSQHPDEFEDIYNNLIKTADSHNECDIRKCSMFDRNHRDRLNFDFKLHFHHKNKHDIIRQQLLDRIHSHFFHSFDMGYKLRRNLIHEISNVNMYENTQNVSSFEVDINLFSQTLNSQTGFKPSSPKKFLTEEDEYSYGFRYFYWKYYKDNMNVHDGAHWGSRLNCIQHPVANSTSTLSDWFIIKKYNDFQYEIINNKTCCISAKSWACEYLKANEYINTDILRSMRCNRGKSAAYYDMHPKQPISIPHLIAMMLYCNYDKLQNEFSKTYRKNKNESDKGIIDRHREYFWFGKLLRECIECFGINHKPPDHLYHGMCGSFAFSSTFACIKGPLSTTKSEYVAVQFCSGEGMVLDLQLYPDEWIYNFDEGMRAANTFCCFECEWISDFSNEQEVLFIGGLGNFIINNIIQVPEGINYRYYVDAINHCTYNCITENARGDPSNAVSTTLQQELVKRLLRHELYCNDPQQPEALEFKECPPKIKNLLHEHLGKMIEMNIESTREYPECFFQSNHDNWIRLDLITAIYPNIQKISYEFPSSDISYFKQKSIYESIFNLLEEKGEQRNLKQICIKMKNKEWLIKDLRKYIGDHHYTSKFRDKYSWDMDIISTSEWTKNIRDVVQESVPTETIQLVMASKRIMQSLHRKVEDSVYDTGQFLLNVLLTLCIPATVIKEHGIFQTCAVLIHLMIIAYSFSFFRYFRIASVDVDPKFDRFKKKISTCVYRYLSQSVLFQMFQMFLSTIPFDGTKRMKIQNGIDKIMVLFLVSWIGIFVFVIPEESERRLLIHILLTSIGICVCVNSWRPSMTIKRYIGICCMFSLIYILLMYFGSNCMLAICIMAFIYRTLTWKDWRATDIKNGGRKSIAAFLASRYRKETSFQRFFSRLRSWVSFMNKKIIQPIVGFFGLYFHVQTSMDEYAWHGFKLTIILYLFNTLYTKTKYYQMRHPILHIIIVYGTLILSIIIQCGFNYISLMLMLISFYAMEQSSIPSIQTFFNSIERWNVLFHCIWLCLLAYELYLGNWWMVKMSLLMFIKTPIKSFVFYFIGDFIRFLTILFFHILLRNLEKRMRHHIIFWGDIVKIICDVYTIYMFFLFFVDSLLVPGKWLWLKKIVTLIASIVLFNVMSSIIWFY